MDRLPSAQHADNCPKINIGMPGETYGRLVIECDVEPPSRQGVKRRRYVRCRCECGRAFVVRLDSLRSGATTSCGCLRAVLPGDRFGRLTAVEVLSRQGATRVRCRCDCGQETVALAGHLRRGRTKSCGCIVRTHGHATHSVGRTPTYVTWMSMRARCSNPNTASYEYYGGRGITVCDRWQHSFDAFLADMGERPIGTTIDRIDPDGDYEPSNCRWATAVEQRWNRRGSVAA